MNTHLGNETARYERYGAHMDLLADFHEHASEREAKHRTVRNRLAGAFIGVAALTHTVYNIGTEAMMQPTGWDKFIAVTGTLVVGGVELARRMYQKDVDQSATLAISESQKHSVLPPQWAIETARAAIS